MNAFKQDHDSKGLTEKDIDLKAHFNVFKKRYWIIIVMLLLGLAGGYYLAEKNSTPSYETSTRIVVDSDGEFMKTLMVMITDPIIMEKVKDDLNLSKSSAGIANQIKVERLEDSQVILISVTDQDPAVAVQIANTTARVFKNEIVDLLEFEGVQLLSKAALNDEPINQNQTKLLILTLLGGLMAGIGLAYLLESLDGSVKNEQEVEDILGVPILGTVSNMKKKKLTKDKHEQDTQETSEDRGISLILSRKTKEAPLKRANLITYSNSTSVISDQFRTIRASIQFVTAWKKKHVFLVTSPGKGEGKSTMIANLAVSMTQQNEKILLIDANMRKPMIHRIFNLPNEEGLTNVLSNSASFLSALNQTGIGNLDILTSGSEAANPPELLGSASMNALLKEVVRHYDAILIDSPGLLESTETRVLANQCDGVVLVLNQGKTAQNKTAEAGKVLHLAHAHLMGVIMNNR
ncbi:Capsular polysaccharide biosynthesis protein CapA [Lentibacillus sp. JNUCC-1]|uniref:polysaccharide biosynthesis tyrosine autokinase n=1 Tax=Lentibacillus sp. JNUCC-1 TaxID=2654513 RepID=UPI0012E81FD4|nr:polysaccharide biosynthesis tyrosine autokinase [Lentibacillus sp. JNUCC-1]MUV36925.1 Capsular polysaccharide biosynthesis protein CapA [Lentibacillus sp. JNUCC-1]